MGIDMMVEAVKLMNSGLQDASMTDFPPEVRKNVDEIKNLLATAIEPYLVDIVKFSDALDAD